VLDEEEAPADVEPAVWERIEQAKSETLETQKQVVEEITERARCWQK